jgi:hypothetical protein
MTEVAAAEALDDMQLLAVGMAGRIKDRLVVDRRCRRRTCRDPSVQPNSRNTQAKSAVEVCGHRQTPGDTRRLI